MSLNESLRKAKQQRNDEFYTQLSDIENELRHYIEHFSGKVVYCNCDDPSVSKFFHYFSYNFERLGLKKLITACYRNQERDLFSRHDSERAIWLEYKGNTKGGRVPDVGDISGHFLTKALRASSSGSLKKRRRCASWPRMMQVHLSLRCLT